MSDGGHFSVDLMPRQRMGSYYDAVGGRGLSLWMETSAFIEIEY